MTDVIVPITPRPRVVQLLAQKLQHVLPSIVLLGDGFFHLGRPAGWAWALGVLEVVTSVTVIALFLRDVRAARRGAHRPHHGHAVDWLDVGLAGMLVVEAAAHHYDTNHWPRPTLLLAATMLAAGLTHGRAMAFVQRRRSLRITSTGLSRGLRLFRRFSATWDQIAGIRVGESRAVVALKGGHEHVIDLAELEGADRIRAALQEAHHRLEAARLQSA